MRILSSSPIRGIRPTLLLTALLAGCAVSPDSDTRSAAAAATNSKQSPTEFVAPDIKEIWPISTRYYRTTSADIYLGNVDAQIVALEAQFAAGHADRAEKLAGQLYHRYKLLGRLADADRATELLADRANKDFLTPSGMVLYAITLSGLHRFEEADVWLQKARNAGSPPEEWRDLAKDILVARGDYAALAEDFATSSLPVADLYGLAHRADLRLLQGDLAGAENHFLAAQTLYRDVNPVPLAWLHTQMGIAYLRFGRIEDARRFFAAAVERLPGYYLAEEHLAECETLLGDLPAARARYQKVIAQTGNPEFVAALSGLERADGNAEMADALVEQAKAGYVDLLARLPSAYAQHASEFFIEIGEPQRGYQLARRNARLRSDIGSLILLAASADAAGKPKAACKAHARAVATQLTPPELAEIRDLGVRCAKAAESDSVVKTPVE
ncbi:MAG: hypothetical protein ACT4NL_03315 [Pseudomarimonas sp.]